MSKKNYYNALIPKRPNYHYEVVGKKTLLGKLGLAVPGHDWDIVAIKKVKND